LDFGATSSVTPAFRDCHHPLSRRLRVLAASSSYVTLVMSRWADLNGAVATRAMSRRKDRHPEGGLDVGNGKLSGTRAGPPTGGRS